MQSQNLVNRQAGGSLLLVIMMIPVVLGIGFAIDHLLGHRAQGMKIMRAKTRMQILAKQVDMAAQTRRSVLLSAKGSSLVSCTANKNCVEGKPKRYNLRNSSGQVISGKYTAAGIKCKGAKCSLLVETFYKIKCNEGRKCTTPAEIITYFRVSQSNKNAFKGHKLNPIKGRTSLSVFACEEDKIIKGVDANGTPICEQPRKAIDDTKCEFSSYGITGDGRLLCQKLENFCKKDLSIVFVLDRSGSMKRGRKLRGAKRSGTDFMDIMRPNDNSAFVSFATNATMGADFNAGNDGVRRSIFDTRANGYTNMTAGLQQAADELEYAPDDTAKEILFISDGQHNVGQGPQRIANELKKNDINIWTIGYGLDADQSMLRNLATSPRDFTHAPGPAALRRVLKSMKATICR